MPLETRGGQLRRLFGERCVWLYAASPHDLPGMGTSFPRYLRTETTKKKVQYYYNEDAKKKKKENVEHK